MWKYFKNLGATSCKKENKAVICNLHCSGVHDDERKKSLRSIKDSFEYYTKYFCIYVAQYFEIYH